MLVDIIYVKPRKNFFLYLKFEDGKWTLNENVDLRNGKSKNKKAKKKHKKS